jgi:WD40 repeat protein
MLQKTITPLTVFLLWLGLPLPVHTGEDTAPRGAVIRLGTVRPRPDFVAYSVCFTANSEEVVFGSEDGLAWRSKIAAGSTAEKHLGHKGAVCAVATSPNGRFLATSDYTGTVVVSECKSGKELHRLSEQKRFARCLGFTPDSTTLITGGEDGTVVFWSTESGKQIDRITAHEACVNCLSISADGKWLATGGQDRVVMVWDLNTRSKRKLTTRKEAIQALSFSLAGDQLVVATDYDADVHLLDVSTGDEVRKFKGDQYGVLAVAFSPDGKTIAAAGREGIVYVYDASDGKLPRRFTGHEDLVRQLAFSPDGKKLASASYDSTVLVWDVSQ